MGIYGNPKPIRMNTRFETVPFGTPKGSGGVWKSRVKLLFLRGGYVRGWGTLTSHMNDFLCEGLAGVALAKAGYEVRDVEPFI